MEWLVAGGRLGESSGFTWVASSGNAWDKEAKRIFIL